MSRLLPVLLLLFLPSSLTGQDDGEAAVRGYFASLQAGEFSETASFFDAEALADFRAAMSFFTELPEDEQQEFFSAFFGDGATAASVRELSDAAFFSAFLSFVMQQAMAAGGLDFDGMEVLGSVAEGDDLRHYVTRNRVSVGEIEVASMEVVSARRTAEGWRLLLSAELEGFAEQLKAAFGAGDP